MATRYVISAPALQVTSSGRINGGLEESVEFSSQETSVLSSEVRKSSTVHVLVIIAALQPSYAI